MKSEKMNFVIVLIMLLVFSHAAVLIAANAPERDGKITVYRCEYASGKVSLQDSPCANASKQEARKMLRPKDAPPPKQNSPTKPTAVVEQIPAPQPFIQLTPPPNLYQCTTYEGKTRDSENYDPNPRCEPLWVLGYREDRLPIDMIGSTCSWVRDSCVKYEGRALCDRWKEKQKQAQSDLRYAFSDTAAFRKSDLARITQIIQQSCQ